MTLQDEIVEHIRAEMPFSERELSAVAEMIHAVDAQVVDFFDNNRYRIDAFYRGKAKIAHALKHVEGGFTLTYRRDLSFHTCTGD